MAAPPTIIKAPEDDWTPRLVLEHLAAIISANDDRYSQRFDDINQAVQTAFAAQKEGITAALTSADRAVNKAEVAAEKRFESVNEFRQTLSDQQRNLMPRAEAEQRMQAMVDKLADFALRLNRQEGEGRGTREGRATMIAGISSVVAVVAVGVSIVLAVWSHAAG